MSNETFWSRVDRLNPYKTLAKLIASTGLDYGLIKHQKMDNRIPKTMDALKLASALNTTVEYLVTGEHYKIYPARIERIINNILYHANEEDLLLIERILRLQKTEEKKDVNVCLA